MLQTWAKLDKLQKRNKQAITNEFNRLLLLGFDEINVISLNKYTKEMFIRLLKNNRAVFLSAAKSGYREGGLLSTKSGFNKNIKAGIDDAWVEDYLFGYNIVTGYKYGREAERKRMRLSEQLLTAKAYNDREAYREAVRKTANLWWTQTAQYGDGAVIKAVEDAYKQAGVKYVKWRTVIDGKECNDCHKLNNKIFAINNIPPRQHYHCRCEIIPLGESK